MLSLGLRFRWKHLQDTFKAFIRFPGFIPASLLLSSLYFFRNPFRASKRFWQERKVEEVDIYGETPLLTLDKIAARAAISPEDTFFDLGMGRGRGALFIKYRTGCKVVGIEIIPEFVKKAEWVKWLLRLKGIWFSLKDLSVADFARGTVFYIYGNFLPDPLLEQIGSKLDQEPKGTKVISVSFPITDYADGYEIQEVFEGDFPWGSTEIYLCKRK